MPKKPEDWLEKASPAEKTKGIFKLFLGYAPGVGKTFSMLSEGIRRHTRGEDVVIGIVETHGRKGIEELAPELEAVPRRKLEYKGTIFEEMDVDAIIARRPAVVLGGRTCAHKYSRQQTSQTLRRCAGNSRRKN